MLPDDGSELCVSSEESTEGFVFRVTRHRVALLPEDQYSSFFVLLSSHSFKLCLWIGSILNNFKRNHFSRLLLTVFIPNYSLLFAFLKVLVEDQLCSESGKLFIFIYLFYHQVFFLCYFLETNALYFTEKFANFSFSSVYYLLY